MMMVELDRDPAAGVPPGPRVASWLHRAMAEAPAISSCELQDWTTLARRQANHARAVSLYYTWHAALFDGRTGKRLEFPDDLAVHQIRWALGMTRRRAAVELEFAYVVLIQLAVLWRAMFAGDLDEERAKVFVAGVAELPDDLAQEVVEALLPISYDMPVPKLKVKLVEYAMALDPEYGKRVHDAAARKADLRGRMNPDGTARVELFNVPADWAAGATANANRLARLAVDDGDPRGVQLLRAFIGTCLLDGTFLAMTEAEMLDYVRSTRPEPDDPDPNLPRPRPAPAPSPAPGATTVEERAAEERAAEERATEERATEESAADEHRSPGGGDPTDDGWDDDGPGDDGPGEDGPGEDGPGEDGPGEDGPGEDGPGEDGPGGGHTGPHPGSPAGPPARAESIPDRRPADAGAARTRPDQRPPEPPEQTAGRSRPAGSSRGLGIHLRAGLAALLGLNAHPGFLVGWGPIGVAHAADLARLHAGGAWLWAVCDDDGYLLHCGQTQARPHGHARRDGRSQAVVELRIPAKLLGRLLEPGADGLPVDPAVLAAWRPVLADVAAGARAAANAPPPDPTARFPGAGLRRHVLLSVGGCIGPWCNAPPFRLEIHHLLDSAKGGPTVEVNLGPVCKPEHRVVTLGAQQVVRTGPHAFTWTNRLGGTCTVVTRPLLENFPEPAPTGHTGWRTEPVAGYRPPPGDDDGWDDWTSPPGLRRDWVGRIAAAVRAAQGERAAKAVRKARAARRPWPPRPARDCSDDPPPF